MRWTGLYKVTPGQVTLGGTNVTGLSPQQDRVARHRADVPEHPPLRAHDGRGDVKWRCTRISSRGSRARSCVRRGSTGKNEVPTQTARELLEFVGILKKDDEYARNLSYGDQRRLEVARALAAGPRVLLLDEPTAGMNPRESA